MRKNKNISIFNDVLGPIMRGPSSSHTAGPYHIGLIARALLGEEPAAVSFVFDPQGSFGEVYSLQGSDLGFAAGVMGIELTADQFPRILQLAGDRNVAIEFAVRPLKTADHPNAVDIHMTGRTGRTLNLSASSIGGGAVVIQKIETWPVQITGKSHVVLVELESESVESVSRILSADGQLLREIKVLSDNHRTLLEAHRKSPLSDNNLDEIRSESGADKLWTAPPVFFVQTGASLFASAAEMVRLAEQRRCSAGRMALAYESELLAISEEEIQAEILRRYDIMKSAAREGLRDDPPPMSLLQPSAAKIYRAEAAGELPIGGLHTRAAARALAVMHINSGQGIVCAAPTAGAAGTLPGVLLTLAEEKGLNRKQIARATLAAAAIGLVVANRATFAAEVAGCQVEIGVAGAMAAAAVVEYAAGSARQACDAAAIALQNTMGSICDPVQALVEIPCHTRNAVAAASAFVCADLILGGYQNPIPLDETIDAMYAVGQMLPRELKCTALGGLSLAPSGLKIKKLK
jgi:L-serine dehydratase